MQTYNTLLNKLLVIKLWCFTVVKRIFIYELLRGFPGYMNRLGFIPERADCPGRLSSTL
jgi:hypothetical protein